MSARTIIEHALRAYYADSAEPEAVARDLLAQYDAERDEEKATASAETAAPTSRLQLLLDAIRTRRGRWTTVTAYRLYRDSFNDLGHVPQTQLRAMARGDLRDLAARGHLLRHEEPGRQYYVLKTRNGGDA